MSDTKVEINIDYAFDLALLSHGNGNKTNAKAILHNVFDQVEEHFYNKGFEEGAKAFTLKPEDNSEEHF